MLMNWPGSVEVSARLTACAVHSYSKEWRGTDFTRIENQVLGQSNMSRYLSSSRRDNLSYLHASDKKASKDFFSLAAPVSLTTRIWKYCLWHDRRNHLSNTERQQAQPGQARLDKWHRLHAERESAGLGTPSSRCLHSTTLASAFACTDRASILRGRVALSSSPK